MNNAGSTTVTARQHALVDGILDHARRAPEATALAWRDEEISYGALLQRVELERTRVARTPPGGPVGVPAVTSPRTIALILACFLERRPLLLPSPTLGREVLDRLYEQARVRHVLTPWEGPADAALTEAPAGGPHDERHSVRPDGAIPGGAGRDAPALLLTTSGSTGTPKIVPLGTAALDRFTVWAGEAFDIGPGTTVLNYAPLNFDLCLLDVWTTLAHGGRVVLVDPDRATQGGYLLDLIRRQRPEVIQAVPMFYRLLADAAGDEGRTLPSVRHAIFTGDSMPAPLLATLPGLLPGARLYNVYGCTETNDSFLHEVTGVPAPGSTLPLGHPLPGVEALLVTGDGAVLDGPGNGELYVSTPYQSEGYLGPAAASGAFVPHPAGADRRRWFRSGDLVRRSVDGALTLVGRTDFQVKVRGVRVNPQEVEQRLLAHPDVAEAAVLALPDPVAGRLLHAVVVRTTGSDLRSLALRGHLAPLLARAALPSTLLVTDEPLPRTATGKTDRERVVRDHFTKES
ncbi:AMP-binding protein [Streptomyces sp. 8N706]|uniref:AMP-binding protein n=1 Tax=Streptomyces sp. 8N706 TaxID=3457416 RepID=UPI003FD38B01